VANYRYAPCLGECGGGILLTKLVGEGESERYLLITDRERKCLDISIKIYKSLGAHLISH
jgi:hypothetical protein